LPSAQRLETLVPVAGHLVHMPAHIYIRVGDYAAAARRNEVAAEVDLDYIQSCGVQGIYPMLYYSHNLHFLAVANALRGRFSDANKAAERLVAHVGPAAKQVPDLEAFLPTQLAILVCFHRWDEILKLPEPDPSLKQNKACWHFARGMAYAASGKSAEAAAERRQLLSIKESLPADAKFGPFNRAHDILKIAELQLSAKIALAGKDPKTAIELLETAVPLEDSLRYMEPPDWYLYSREALGAALVSAGEYARAETVYRTDLEKNPRKGRALFGLQASLNAQGKKSSAGQVQREFAKAWENADTPLRSDDLW
jgi:tetratricopeptide (TPR) repeat protein